ncbi:hypothetical protein PENTCL1PPCAC_8815, partial [Pristionchus entomophagus]
MFHYEQMHIVIFLITVFRTPMLLENCKMTWWMNALYINNFADVFDICYPPSWFLSVDTQLFWAAPIFLIAIFYSCEQNFLRDLRRTGFGAVIGGIVFSVITTFFLTAYYDLPAVGFTMHASGILDFMTHFYIKPWIRCIPYLIGILCGYFIVQVRNQNIKLRQPKMWELVVCWLFATVIALTVIFSVYNYIRGTSDWSVVVRSLYGSFARIGWSLEFAWVILACTFDWAGPVKAILEHPLWYPLGRLSYCTFLAHWFIMYSVLNGSDGPVHFVSLWHTYLTLTVPVVFLSYVWAYMWSCLVEIPFAKIE